MSGRRLFDTSSFFRRAWCEEKILIAAIAIGLLVFGHLYWLLSQLSHVTLMRLRIVWRQYRPNLKAYIPKRFCWCLVIYLLIVIQQARCVTRFISLFPIWNRGYVMHGGRWIQHRKAVDRLKTSANLRHYRIESALTIFLSRTFLSCLSCSE